MITTQLNLIRRGVFQKDVISGNVSNYKHWTNKTKSCQQVKLWNIILRGDTGLDIPVKQEKFKRLIKIKRVISGRMKPFDKVNLYTAIKPLEDALVNLGWLIDDSDIYRDLEVCQARCEDLDTWEREQVKYGSKIFVEIYDLEENIP